MEIHFLLIPLVGVLSARAPKFKGPIGLVKDKPPMVRLPKMDSNLVVAC